MFTVMMVVDGENYEYGTYESRNEANEIAMWVRDKRNVDTYIVPVED